MGRKERCQGGFYTADQIFNCMDSVEKSVETFLRCSAHLEQKEK